MMSPKTSMIFSLIFLTLTLAACNNVNSSGTLSGSSSSGTSATTTTSTTGLSFQIVTGSVVTTNNVTTLTLGFNATASNNLLNICTVQAENNNDKSRACKCKFEWSETNTASSSVVNRVALTDPSQITSFQLQCLVPAIWTTEIADNTIIKLSVAPDVAVGNSTGFSTNKLSYTKTPSTSTGDFKDIEGRTYKNIFHYVCYDKIGRSLGIDHKARSATNPSTTISVMARLANYFRSSDITFSAQSYYYDFYVRSNDLGSINTGNSGFTCPMVAINGLPSFYPLDTSFAIGLQQSKDFNIQLNSNTVVSPAGVVSATLGYAAKPNSDGSCPAFLDSNNQIRRTFRLRMYSAVYPLRYSGNGVAGSDGGDPAQKTNTIYVLDRPVNKASQDPLKPITRLGPKPCPFSYKTKAFGYKCMTDATLSGLNIDGTQIDGDKTCPIYPPIPANVLADQNATATSQGALVIRPYKSFIPNYLENTNFKACAFQSSTPVDAEIVLSHDDNVYNSSTGPHDFYCARHYPPAGAVIPPPNGDPFDKAPGDCSLSDSASAIKSDLGYACLKTYDPFANPKKTAKAGCCQICAGTNCTSSGGGITPVGRNAAFSPPADGGNPATGTKTLPRAIPNQSGQGGCFDPHED